MNRPAAPRHVVAIFMVLAVLAWTGCGKRDTVQVTLLPRGPANQEVLQLQIDAVITGSLANLRYKWFAVSGSCTPQVTTAPGTLFRFAEGVARDRVTVEVWRGETQVGRGEVDVNFQGELAKRLEVAPTEQDVFVEVTVVPPREPGGDHTRSDISGRVTGKLSPDYRIIVYARAYENWYIQPTVQALHPIKADGTWSTWTHTGDSYAVLVVRSDYVPMMRLDILPQVGGYIKARTVFEGRQ